MGLRIQSNLASWSAGRALESTTGLLGASFRRLSAGLRITGAADDPAGLAMSERLRAQIRSLDQAQRNASDGIALVQTAEGALTEVGSMLTRLRELAVQAGNGTVSNADRDTLNQEFAALAAEVDRIGRSAEFNGIKLLDGSSSSVSLQVGTGTDAAADTVSVQLSPALGTTLGLTGLNIGSTGDPSAAITSLDSAINAVGGLRARFGGVQNRLTHAVANLGVASENFAAAESRIRDLDVARETARMHRLSVVQQAGLAVLAQANLQPESVLRLLA